MDIHAELSSYPYISTAATCIYCSYICIIQEKIELKLSVFSFCTIKSKPKENRKLKWREKIKYLLLLYLKMHFKVVL